MTELEKENSELKLKLNTYESEYKEQCTECFVTYKLEENISEMNEQINNQCAEITRLKSQIEKMKCCGNCKNNGMNCIWFKNHNKECKNLDKWELSE